MLKTQLTSTEFAALNDILKTEYKLAADGHYHIDLGAMFVTDKDPNGLFSALESERTEHKTTKAKFDAIIKERDDAKNAAKLAEAQKTGDIEAIKKVMEDALEQTKRQFQKQVDEQKQQVLKQQENVAKQLHRTKALEIATEVFGPNAAIMLPHVMAGLAPVAGDNPTLQVVKSDGTVDLTMGVDDYKKSLLTNDLFKPMIVASKASGGSANDGTGNVPANRKADGSPKIFKDYAPGELMTMKKNNPDEFKRIMATANS